MATQETLRSASRRVLDPRDPVASGWAALGVLAVVAAAFIFYETRGTIFWGDEWAWVLDRRGWDLDTFLEPHNEHLSLIPVAVYKLMFATVGLEHYAPYRALVIVAHVGCACLVFIYASRRVGTLLAVCAAALLLFLGPAWQNVLWPFQIAWLISLAAGVVAMLALDRGERRGDVVACVSLAVALTSSGLGVAIAMGVIVELLWARRGWRDLWIAAIPLAPYAIWWLAYRPAGLVKGNIDLAFHFAAESAGGTLSALVGLAGPGAPDVDALEWGRPLGVVAAIALVWLLSRYPRIPPRVLGLLTILASFWVLTALRRAMLQEPDTSRYLYVGALFVLLLAAELARGTALRRRLAPVLVVGVAAVTLANAGTLRDGGRYLRGQAEISRADLAAIELARDDIEPGYIANFPGAPFIVLAARPYLDAAEELGSPAYSAEELPGAPEAARIVADAELIRIHELALRATSSGGAPFGNPPAIAPGAPGRTSEEGACARLDPFPLRPSGDVPAAEVTIPAGGVLVRTTRAPVRLHLRRFAAGWSNLAPDTVAPGAVAALNIPPDLNPQPWRMRIAAQGRVSVCALR